jgi:hypothetical protein
MRDWRRWVHPASVSKRLRRSRRSRRPLSTKRSAIPFCQGLAIEVRTARTPSARIAIGTSNPNFASRSKIFAQLQHDMTHELVGWRVRFVYLYHTALESSSETFIADGGSRFAKVKMTMRSFG